MELADAGWMTHFAKGLGFDLADAFARDAELFADFFQGARVAVAYAEAQLWTMDEAALDQFEALLTAPDQEVYAWLSGAEPVPAEYDNPVFAGLKAVCGRKNPKWNG